MGVSMTKKELATIAGYTYRRLYDIDRDLPEGRNYLLQESEANTTSLFLYKNG